MHDTTTKSATCIVLVNWNGAEDTIECLDSLTRIDAQEFTVVVCDNASQDRSLEKIHAWASTSRMFKGATSSLSREVAENAKSDCPRHAKLVLIQTGGNLGFAGANNVGMRFALNCGNFSHVWLLNNDTTVDPAALSAMHLRLQQHRQPAICGSQIMFYDNPGIIQALGGARFNRWTGISSTTLGRGLDNQENIDHRETERRLSYVSAASCLVPLQFIREVGYMAEHYFLYCEEVDWTFRAQGKFDLLYSEYSYVYHKEGSSIGSPSQNRDSSQLSDFYIFRNKLRVIRKFNLPGLPVAYVYSLLQAVNRARRGQWKKALLIVKVLTGMARHPA